MATITVTDILDVEAKYEVLVKQSLSGESAYIRAKETIQELFDNGTITETQRAEVVSNIIGGIANSITTASMSTAIQWASAEKDVALKKLELSKQLDILDKELLLKTAQIEQATNATKLAKVESLRIYGAAVFDGSGSILSIDNTGKVAKDIELTTAQITKTATEDSLTSQKIAESHAAVHKIVADTYVNYGNFSYTGLGVDGITSIAANHLATHKTLSDAQKDIAIEQAKGYTYNAWANALTGSASMLGTAIAAEYAEFGPGTSGETLLNTVLATAQNLKAASTTSDEAVPAP